MHYVMFQITGKNPGTIVPKRFPNYETARTYFEKEIYKIKLDERISFPIQAETDEEAVAKAKKGNDWAQP